MAIVCGCYNVAFYSRASHIFFSNYDKSGGGVSLSVSKCQQKRAGTQFVYYHKQKIDTKKR